MRRAMDDDEFVDSRGAVPTYELSEEEVETTEWDYSDRAVDDWVLSGPCGDNEAGPGRYFETLARALVWARMKYGARVKRPIYEALPDRWAILVRRVE